MPTQGDAHVVHPDGDGVASKQAFVQQFDLGALDEAELQQATLQFGLMLMVVALDADLNDDAAITPSGLAEFDGVGHGAHYDGGRAVHTL